MIKVGRFIADRYEILGVVGSGGMSEVYKAKDHKLNRLVAIKVLKKEFSEDATFVSKFKVEAQSAAGLSHPNVVNVYDVGEENGIYFIVMELVEGITLKRYIEKKGHLSAKETISIAIQVSQGIEAAHANHIIHRDIKPQNIIISKTGKVKVADFGIARAASSNTINSNAMGSVHYISPEQARGGYIDERSDIYSLGITLYEMLTGELPFQGESTVTVALQHIQEELPSLDDKVEELPISLKKIIMKCTQKKPERRYAKVSSLIADLKHSLIEPDEDFVFIAPLVNEEAPTVLITDAELKDIKKGASAMHLSEEDLESDEEDDALILDEDVEDEDDDDIDESEDAEDLDIDKINPKLEKIISIGSIAAAAIIVILVLVVCIKLFSGGTGETQKQTTSSGENQTLDAKHVYMPNLLGMEENEVADYLNKNFSLGVSFEYAFNADYAKGQVCNQSIKEKSVVAKNTTITVTISQGGKRIAIPDFKGYTLEQVREWGEENEITIHVTEWVIDDKVPMNSIVSWAPTAPTQLLSGGTLDVVVSRGDDQSKDVEIPSCLKLTKDEAVKLLEEMGLSVGEIEEEFNDSIEEGKICGQYPLSGNKLPKGSKVDLIVSKGVGSVKVPKVVGETEASAIDKLKAQRLKAEVGYEFSDTVAAGIVIEQSENEGTSLPVDSTVMIVVSKGELSYGYTVTIADVNSSDMEIAEETGTVSVKLVLVLENGQEIHETLLADGEWTADWTYGAIDESGTNKSKVLSAYATVEVVTEANTYAKKVDATVTIEE